tara:strand:- start:16 stop:336 length:321 start_codon:yes stop_codon:yes gene_type:complete
VLRRQVLFLTQEQFTKKHNVEPARTEKLLIEQQAMSQQRHLEQNLQGCSTLLTRIQSNRFACLGSVWSFIENRVARIRKNAQAKHSLRFNPTLPRDIGCFELMHIG